MKSMLVAILLLLPLLLSACIIRTVTVTPQETFDLYRRSDHVGSVLVEFAEQVSDNDTCKWMNESGKWKPATAIINGEEKTLTSKYFKEISISRDNDNTSTVLTFEFNDEGGKILENITERLVGKQMGIFVENEPLLRDDGKPLTPKVISMIPDGKIELSGITTEEANRIFDLINTNDSNKN